MLMKRYDLTARELADMRDSQRDSVKYLDGSFRELVESRHVYRDDDEAYDMGAGLIGAHSA
jgi:hypothetical protein